MFNDYGRYGLQAPNGALPAPALPVNPTQQALFFQGLNFPQQGLFAPGQKPKANVKLPLIREGILGDSQSAPQTPQQAPWTSGYDVPSQDQAPQAAAASAPPGPVSDNGGQGKFAQLLNDPMFQFGISLLGNSTSPNPWGGALQQTLQAQLASAQSKRQQALADLEAKRVGLEGRRVDLEGQRVGIEQQRANTEGAQGQQRIDLSRAGLEQQAPLVQAQIANLASEGKWREVQGLLEQAKVQQIQQQLDRQAQFQGPLMSMLTGTGLFGGSGSMPNGSGMPTPIPQGGPTGKYGTPTALLDGLARVESSGNPNAVNAQTGATGMYQFLPSTVQMLAKQGLVFDPRDPAGSRDAADFYLQQLAKQNGGDMRAALAAYGGFKSKDPTDYINRVTQGMPVASGTNVPQQATPGPTGLPTGDTSARLGQAAALAGLAGLPGAEALGNYAKLMQPQPMQPGYVRDPGTGQTTFLADPYKEGDQAIARARLGLEQQQTQATTAKTAQEIQGEQSKQAEGQANAKMEANSIMSSLDRLSNTAAELNKHPGLEMNAGWYGALGAYKVPGSKGADAAAMLDTLKSKLLVGVLSDLKTASKNGSSGFGQLSEREGQRLETYQTNLERAQSLPQLQKALQDIQDFAAQSKERYATRFNELYSKGGNPGVAPSIGPQSVGATPAPQNAPSGPSGAPALMSLDDYLKSKRPKAGGTAISPRERVGTITYGGQ